MKHLTWLLLLLPSLLFSQQNIIGKLIDKDTKAPVVNATVYVNNTQLSTLSGADGMFQFSVPANTSSIVISHIGYKKLSFPLKTKTDTLVISLEPDAKTMENITVKAGVKGDWKKWGKLFTEQFIGTGDVAKTCRLLNPEAVNFSYHEENRMLIAWAKEPLLIENKGLGYIVHVDLDYFRYYDAQGVFGYSVSSFFEAVKPDKEDEQENAAARLLSYRGSKMHFARSVFKQEPVKEGFRLYTFKALQNEEKSRIKRLLMENNVKSIVAAGKARPGSESDSNWYYAKVMQEKDYLSIDTIPLDLPARIRNKSAESIQLSLGADTVLLCYSEAGVQNVNSQQLRKLTKLKFRNDGKETIEYFRDTKNNIEYSLVYLQRGNVLTFTKEGLVLADDPPVMEGFLSGRRMAYSLPFDYDPQADLEKMGEQKGIDLLVNKYFDYHKENKESFHTHFNKAVFFPGERIWFKVYTLNFVTRRPFTDTRNMLVELLDPAGKVVAKKILFVNEAVTQGNFELKRNITPGIYTFRAYTNWSKNFGEQFYFTQTLTVIGKTAAATAVNAKEKPDVQFFPEGGTLVSGVQNRLAFKITSPNGYGVKAEGTLRRNGQAIQQIATNHLGIGSFKYMPVAGEEYTAVFPLTGKDSFTIQLPKSVEKGITLSADALNGDSVRVTVMASPAAAQELKGQPFNIFVHRQGNGVYFGGQFGSAHQFILPKSYFPEGVAHITLFDQKDQPIADRAVFIAPVIPSMTVEAKRVKDSVSVTVSTMQGSQPVSANLSASVLPVGTFADNFGRNIYSRFFLEGDIKGFIEQPSYYFEEGMDKRKTDMDNLLLVQGWRSYDWNRILNGRPDSSAYAFEEGFTLKAVIPGYKPAKKQKDTTSFFLFSQKDDIFMESKLTKAGAFLFSRLYLQDSSQVMLNTADKKFQTGLDDLVTVVEGRSFDSINRTIAKPLVPAKLDKTSEENNITIAQREMETVVIGTAAPEKKLFAGDHTVNLGDRTYKIDEKAIERHRTLLELLRNQFGVQSSVNSGGDVTIQMLPGAAASTVQGPSPILIIDGMQMSDLNYLRLLRLADVEAIAVNKFGNTMLGSRGGGGSITIKTRTGYDDPVLSTPVVKTIWMEGYASPSAYFSPGYAVPASHYLHTRYAALHWEPVVVTGANGKGNFMISIPLELKSFKIRIEGISVNGGLLFLEKEIKLE